MPQKSDYYATLGVARGASAEEIHKAYRNLAKKHHPDRNPGDKAAEQKFKEINEAHDVLKDDQKRAAYDRFGHAAFENGARADGGASPFGPGFHAGGSAFFNDVFEEMFGFGTRPSSRGTASRRGADLRTEIRISLEEAFHGKRAEFRLNTTASCAECRGTGAAKGSSPVVCPTCAGQGRLRQQSGFFTIDQTCPRCKGRGKTIEKPCKACAGAGIVPHAKTIAVDIPPGVESGTTLRLRGQGMAGAAGPGDLHVAIVVMPHPRFERNGSTLTGRISVPMTTAALGGSIDVATLDGSTVSLTIPEGTQSGRRFCVAGKGMPVLKTSNFGDLIVEASIETPVNLTARQKDLLREFEAQDTPKSVS